MLYQESPKQAHLQAVCYFLFSHNKHLVLFYTRKGDSDTGEHVRVGIFWIVGQRVVEWGTFS